jgi:hypothetical protein
VLHITCNNIFQDAKVERDSDLLALAQPKHTACSSEHFEFSFFRTSADDHLLAHFYVSTWKKIILVLQSSA